MSWAVVAPGRRWSYSSPSWEGRRFAALVGLEMREYREESRGGPTLDIYEPDDLYEGCSAVLAEPGEIVEPLAEMTLVRTTEPIREPLASRLRSMGDEELFAWLESGHDGMRGME